MQFARLTAPATEPVSLATAKAFCRVEDSASDALIGSLISAAREHVEGETGLVLASATFSLVADRFPSQAAIGEEEWWDGVRDGAQGERGYASRPLELPLYPVTAVTAFAVDGAAIGTTYTLDSTTRPARLIPGGYWPVPAAAHGGIALTVTAGYSTANVPPSLVQAVLMLVAHWYENREAVGTVTGATALGLERLLSGWRLVLA